MVNPIHLGDDLRILESGFCWRTTRWARLASVNPQFGVLWPEDLHSCTCFYSALVIKLDHNENGGKKKSCLFMKSVPPKPATSALDERCSSRLRADEFHDNLMMTIRITAGRERKKMAVVLILNINNASWHLTIYLLLVWRQRRSCDRIALRSQPAQ